MNGSPCVPAVHYLTGEILKAGSARGKARKILIQREGPPPFEGAVCRHLCENDSMAPNGIVCTAHTTWGTWSENNGCDKSPENRAKGGKHRSPNGGRISGKIVANRPDSSCRLEVTCPHCGKTGQKIIMGRWHFDNCKYRNPEETGV